LCCFGDPLGSYGGSVAEVIISLGSETVYLDPGQLLSFNVSLQCNLLSAVGSVCAVGYTESNA
jgi:hypothetical protein